MTRTQAEPPYKQAERDALAEHRRGETEPMDTLLDELESVLDAGRAVLEAVAACRTAFQDKDSVLHGPVADEFFTLLDTFDALAAAKQPKKHERPAMVAVEVASDGDIRWATHLHHCGNSLWVARLACWSDLRYYRRVLPESEHAEPWRECDRALAENITQAMEDSRDS